MWGTAAAGSAAQIEQRFIPTHVGNGPTRRVAATRPPVHPHACGERPIVVQRLQRTYGSSPRMWGTGIAAPGLRDDFRFIPTHVGNGPTAWRSCSFRPVHPHACGERAPNTVRAWFERGSSPRMWGTGAHSNTEFDNIAVHPHACGERSSDPPKHPASIGSSPRMWGTVDGPRSAHPNERFIPTHVGNGCWR